MRGAYTSDQVGFGETLRRFRVAAGLTQEALAERAELSARGISDLERAARTRPYPTTVHRLASALGLSPADQAILMAAADAPSARDAGQLPTPLSSLVGREQDIAEVRKLLARHRLVTLLGP